MGKYLKQQRYGFCESYFPEKENNHLKQLLACVGNRKKWKGGREGRRKGKWIRSSERDEKVSAGG